MLLGLPDDIHEEKSSFLQFKKKRITDGRTDGRTDPLNTYLVSEKIAMRPLKYPKNALFSKIAAKQIYFWPYFIKGSYLEYQNHTLKMVIDPWPGDRTG